MTISTAAPPTESLFGMWRTMVRIRLAEEAIAALIESGEARGPCHLYIGQEAIAAGVCAALRREDTIWGGHRSHGHYLAKCESSNALRELFAEVLGKTTGCSGGRGGSMHLFNAESGILGTVPIVAATVPLACGAAMAYKLRAEPHVAIAFFGDGTVEEGHVHESLNLAALYKLPVIFTCENNLYASHLHWSERRVSDNLDRAGDFHSIPSRRVDGNNAIAVHEAARDAVERARSGGGPTFIECRTFRWRGHVGASYDLDVGVQRRPELREWVKKDPIGVLEARLMESHESTFPGANVIDSLAQHRAAMVAEIVQALDFARRSPSPAADRVTEHVWVDGVRKEPACAR